MIRHEALGVWQTVVKLPPGRHRYRLVIDGQWTQDPHNPHTETNPFGERNNVVVVPAAVGTSTVDTPTMANHV
jgi:chromosome partitioning protein